MEASIVDLRYRMKDVLRAIDRGETVTVLYRGKERARLVPSSAASGKVLVNPRDHPACGMWKDREDMADPVAYIRKLREPRYGHLFDEALPAAPRAKRKKKPVAVAKRAPAQKQRKSR
jgi:antitoxin (DNA-binding transcriptional repressor) of toxin-antitoxin stability system